MSFILLPLRIIFIAAKKAEKRGSVGRGREGWREREGGREEDKGEGMWRKERGRQGGRGEAGREGGKCEVMGRERELIGIRKENGRDIDGGWDGGREGEGSDKDRGGGRK